MAAHTWTTTALTDLWRSRFNASLTAARKETWQGLYDIHTNVMQWPRHMQPTHARWSRVDETTGSRGEDTSTNGALPRLDSVYARHFRIHDLCLQSAPDSTLGSPGADENEGLSTISDDVLEELPVDCLGAFEEAKARETKWRNQWHSERIDGLRAHFLPSVEWYPK